MLRRDFLVAAAAAPLAARREARPRLFLDAAGFARLKEAIGGTHAPIWARVKERADRTASRQPPRYEDQRPPGANDEQLWQRPVGEAMPYAAMAFRLTGDPKYLRAARDWALASCGYPRWGTGTIYDADLAAGHQLVGLAVVFDWLHDDLDAEARDTIRATLIRRGNDMFAGVPKRRKPLLQNHLWVSITGLGAAAFALLGEKEAGYQPQVWLDMVREKYHGTEWALGSDGASHEGVPYWTYGVEYMLKWWHLASDLLGENPTSVWWKHTAAYRLYLGIPRNSWTYQSTIVDIADGPRADYYGADHLMHRLAQLYRDPYAQWVAQQLDEARASHDTAGWLNLVWYDPGVPAVAPARLPTLRHFADLGIVSARSDWSGGESLVAFKCGPPGGHEAKAKFSIDPGTGHAHPDANHFVVFGAGEWLLRDDGYARKFTSHHNTLLVDGRGQLGEGGDWLNARAWYPGPEVDPRVLEVKPSRRLDEMAGQAATAYPVELGLKHFVRRLLYLKPNVLIVADDIEADRDRRLELLFHPERAPEKMGDGAFVSKGEKAVLRVEPLTPEGLEIKAGNAQVQFMHAAVPMYEIRLGRQAASWRNAVAVSWAPSGEEPPRVTLTRSGDEWTFRAGGRSCSLRWDKA